WSLQSMIVFRVLQGLAGGALIPFAFSLVLTKLPLDIRPKGMALFAITATFAPSIGPTIGGWLTENFGWEWIFYINVVPGALMTLGLPYGLDRSPPRWELLRKGDYAGIVTMAIGLGCLQVCLEEVLREDWLESSYIITLGSIALISLACFVILQLSQDNHLVNLRLLTQRNFLPGSLANIVLGVGLYVTVFVLPVYLSAQRSAAFPAQGPGRQSDQLSAGARTLRDCILVAGLPGTDPGLQRAADRSGGHVAAPAAAAADSAGPGADAAHPAPIHL